MSIRNERKKQQRTHRQTKWKKKRKRKPDRCLSSHYFLCIGGGTVHFMRCKSYRQHTTQTQKWTQKESKREAMRSTWNIQAGRQTDRQTAAEDTPHRRKLFSHSLSLSACIVFYECISLCFSKWCMWVPIHSIRWGSKETRKCVNGKSINTRVTRTNKRKKNNWIIPHDHKLTASYNSSINRNINVWNGRALPSCA